jgi:hypothetical protein
MDKRDTAVQVYISMNVSPVDAVLGVIHSYCIMRSFITRVCYFLFIE